ncbi:Sugar transferase involved in LPS biosynthesis (colanic, teichoic acid) [[Clostridium] aminophilum]|uniref:Sugar transferase involved in LPS biosynthesis (Colanic, teichoic acid) n=2 Tax=[Clostridium] aminophilum TaxID=1526 RepID=A0A1I6K6A8_9FIRM|nr:Sugar transferase involved in LPS biosynthesis (colanic, teichoic acid) [[Clostridium] aminophilum]
MAKTIIDQMPKVRRSVYTIFIKRLFDILLSGIAILVLSPLLLVIAILELVFHGRPVLFAQERPGLHGKIFRIYKFRSMTNETDEDGNLLPEEQRATKFGRFIRRFSLDELPELFCIFTGKMSIIGPRPLLVRYLPLYTPRHMMRHEVRPGFACVPIEPLKTWTWNDQFENDIWYIENCSFLVDVKMIFAVAREAIAGADYRVSGIREEFNGKNLDKDV